MFRLLLRRRAVNSLSRAIDNCSCLTSESVDTTAQARSTSSQGASASNPSTQELPSIRTSDVGKVVAAEFRKEPQRIAQEIAQNLGTLDRSLLLSALSAAESGVEQQKGSQVYSGKVEGYAAAIFDTADQQAPKGLLDREEFVRALSTYDVMQQKEAAAKSILPVRGKSLMLLALGTGIPYVGFGFLDNFIMITAGEEIEKAFGVALGLSTMGAAALGNMFSDIAGIWMAETIEQRSKRIKSLQPPRLSHVQEAMMSVRVAKSGGAIIGVVLGCTLGMIPLLYYSSKGNKKVPENQRAGQKPTD
ncbi:hypothetical protein BSKO_09388 [Bryopsis sp. KO-2023]|nr:hypothetical protein BSKO_09388 [Bryopsis sp. KO-2023]